MQVTIGLQGLATVRHLTDAVQRQQGWPEVFCLYNWHAQVRPDADLGALFASPYKLFVAQTVDDVPHDGTWRDSLRIMRLTSVILQ